MLQGSPDEAGEGNLDPRTSLPTLCFPLFSCKEKGGQCTSGLASAPCCHIPDSSSGLLGQKTLYISDLKIFASPNPPLLFHVAYGCVCVWVCRGLQPGAEKQTKQKTKKLCGYVQAKYPTLLQGIWDTKNLGRSVPYCFGSTKREADLRSQGGRVLKQNPLGTSPPLSAGSKRVSLPSLPREITAIETYLHLCEADRFLLFVPTGICRRPQPKSRRRWC